MTNDVDGAIVTNCIVEYIGDSFIESSATVTNVGTLGSAANGTAFDTNDYALASSGAKCFVFADSGDLINGGSNSGLNNVSSNTWEFAFKTGSTLGGRLFQKNNLMIFLQNDGSIRIENFSDPSVDQIDYGAEGVFAANTNYFVQIVWDKSTVTPASANTPTLYVNGSPVSMTKYGSSSNTAWLDDSSTTYYYHYLPVTSTIYLLRWHNVALSSGDLTTNYNASKWRVGVSTPTWTETVVPTCTTTAAHAVSESESIGILQVPSCTTASSVPTITIPKMWTETIVPHCTTASSSPLVTRDHWIETVVPDCGTASHAPSVTTTTPPLYNWIETVVPNAPITSTSPMFSIALAETVVPSCTTASSELDILIVGYSETVIPSAITGILRPRVTASSVITEAVVPTCTTSASLPAVFVLTGIGEMVGPRVTGAQIPDSKARILASLGDNPRMVAVIPLYTVEE